MLLGLLVSFAPVFAAVWPPNLRPYHVDLLSHFAPHTITLLAAIFALSFVTRSNVLRLVCAGAFVASLVIVALAYRPLSGASPKPGLQPVRVVHFNALNVASSWDDAFVAWLLAQDADLISIVDAPPGLIERNPIISERYPHRVTPKRGWEWPIMLLSKHPLREVSLGPTSKDTRTSFVARRSAVVMLPNRTEVLFTAMHPYSPRSERAWRRSLEIVARDAPLLRDAHEHSRMPVIVGGDFNSTPTGRVYRTFATISGLKSSPTLPIGTWPAKRHRLVGVAIDHVFASPEIEHIDRRVGPSFRSDHRPIVVDLAVPPSDARQSPPPNSPPPLDSSD